MKIKKNWFCNIFANMVLHSKSPNKFFFIFPLKSHVAMPLHLDAAPVTARKNDAGTFSYSYPLVYLGQNSNIYLF
jgi:hypothetical protein